VETGILPKKPVTQRYVRHRRSRLLVLDIFPSFSPPLCDLYLKLTTLKLTPSKVSISLYAVVMNQLLYRTWYTKLNVQNNIKCAQVEGVKL